MSPNSADKEGYYIFNLNSMKNEPQIGRRPIKEILCFILFFLKKSATNRPEANKRDLRFYLIKLTNEP
jgi:hypothetical protein